MEKIDDRIDLDELFREIERYLDVVEEFRAAGCDVGGLLSRPSDRRTQARPSERPVSAA